MSLHTGKRALVAATTPVDGLPRRELPLLAVFTQSIAATAPSGAAATIPALVISSAGGGGAVAAFVAATVVMVLVSACLRPTAQRMAAVGGLYTYTARGLGPLVAIPTGWSAIIGYAAVAMAGVVAVGTYLSNIAVALGLTAVTPTTAIVVLGLLGAAAATVVMLRGIRMSARVTLLIECVSLVLLAIVLVLLLTAPRAHGIHAPSPPWHDQPQNMAINIVVAISAFVGFESSTTLGGEARQPFLSVPRTLRWTPVAAAVAFLTAVSIQALAMSGAPSTVLDSSTPLAALLAANDSPGLSAILDLAIAASYFACTLASVNALVRVLFSMGREGVAPASFGRTHRRFKTPAFAIAVAMAVVTAASLLALIAGVAPDQALRAFLTMSACGYLGSYLASCAATPALLRRIGELTPGILLTSVVTTFLLGALIATAVVVAVREGALVLTVYTALLCVAAVYSVLLKWLAPARLSAVGIYDETQRTDMLNTVPFR